MDRAKLSDRLKDAARNLGFSLAGICPAVTPAGLHRLTTWLNAGYAGEMEYIPRRADAYADPTCVLDGAKSIFMLAMNYRNEDPAPPETGFGRVSRYAWGIDYHDVIHDRLKRLQEALQGWAPGARTRGVVDTAPLLEKEFAQLAGLGWIGKNTLLLNKSHGSWFFLAALLVDVELAYDTPIETDHCGTCTACLDACPTGAFVAPYVLDSRRCISYLTIELRGNVPEELRQPIDDWFFGCDICQEVCPWNHRAPLGTEPAFQPREGLRPLELTSLFSWTDDDFRQRFRATPLWRAKRRGLLRNAAIVLGNQRAPYARDALLLGASDPEPIVCEACLWALEQLENA